MLKKFKIKIRKFYKNEKSQMPVAGLSDEKIIKYKSKAWQSEAMTEIYKKNVDKNFFEGISSKYFLKHINPTDHVLDVGAGTGRLSIKLAEAGCTVVATDISASMLKVLEEQKNGLDISTVVASAEQLPFENEIFDVITHMDFIIHFPNWQQLLKEQLRVCKTGGIIVYNHLNGDHLDFFDGDRKEAAAYLTCGDFVSSASVEELAQFCIENNCSLVSIQPYSYFDYNIFYSSNLTAEEAKNLQALIIKASLDARVLSVMQKIDQEITCKLCPELCGRMIVCIRRN